MKLSTATEILKNAGIEDPKREARYLFSHFSNLTQSSLYVGDPECDSEELSAAIKKRRERVPLQYIIGEVEFYRETYTVSADCLIPRSDTEILVDEAIKRLPRNAKFADLCTGSGCVALSVLNNTEQTSAVAMDISEGALEIAKKNAKRLALDTRIEFISADVLKKAAEGNFFAILSNPPYVTESAYENLAPEIYFEPKIAFLGGTDGLDFYRKIIPMYFNSIEEGGFFAFEIGYDQAEALKTLASDHGMNCEIIYDFSKNPRVAVLTK